MIEADDSKSSRSARRFRICNRRDIVLTLVLEPWATEYMMAPQETLEIVGRVVLLDRDPPTPMAPVKLCSGHACYA